MNFERLSDMYFVKCQSPSQTLYACNVSTGAEAFAMAHLLAEVFEEMAIVYKPNEETHYYQASGRPDITNRFFT